MLKRFAPCILLLLAACGGTDGGQADHADHDHADHAAPSAPAGAFAADLFSGDAGGTPVGVGAMKSSAKQGERVVIAGRIGGSEHPFLADRAMFVLVDPSVKLCGEGEPGDDHCKTPWDFCCEPKENLRKMSVTVVANGPDGAPIAHTLLGQGGLKPGGAVVVEGVVASIGPDGVALISANRLLAK